MISTQKKLSEIQALLRDRIEGGEWGVGERLPTDSVLAKRLGCSVGTVGKALGLLAHDGVVERKPRAGTTVLRNSTVPRPPAVQLDALAFIYPSDRHEGISRMLHGFEDAAREKGRRLVMLPTGVDFKKEAEIIASLQEFDVRGAAACPVISTPQEQLRMSQLLLGSRVPIVLMGLNLLGFSSAAVLLDNFEAGHAMTTHFLRQGETRIGFLSNWSWIQFMRDRFHGYRRAMEEAGLPIGDSWVHLAEAMHPNMENPTREPLSIARAYLSANRDVKAVVCANDFLALALKEAALEAGLRVPEDLKIAGIDDFDIAARAGVTTYRVPYEEMGRKAFELLQDWVVHPNGRSRELLLRGEIVPRRSA